VFSHGRSISANLTTVASISYTAVSSQELNSVVTDYCTSTYATHGTSRPQDLFCVSYRAFLPL
jgi:hypothetical protein